MPINWDKLRNREIQPPFRPKEGKLTENFDKYFTKADPVVTPTDKMIVAGIPQDQFNGFSFDRDLEEQKVSRHSSTRSSRASSMRSNASPQVVRASRTSSSRSQSSIQNEYI